VPTRNSSQGGLLKTEVAGNSYEDFMKKKRADDANFQKEFPVQLPDTFKGGSSENSPKSKAARKEAEALRDSLIAQGYNAAVKHTTSSYAAYGKGTVTTSSFKVFRSEGSGGALKSEISKSNLSEAAKAEIQARFEKAQARYEARMRGVKNSQALRDKEIQLIKDLQDIRERESKAQSLKSDLKPKKNELDTKVAGGSVETWYDKGTRSWVTQTKDAEGNQVGEAEYTGRGKASAKNAHDFAVGEASRRLNR